MAKPGRKERIPLEQVRWQLGTIWFVGAALIFLLLIIQSLTGVYEHRVQGVWGWALPNFVPTLSLMIGVFAATALEDEVESDHMKVRKPFARLAVAISLFHLLSVAMTLLAHPFTATFLRKPDGEVDMMAVFDISNFWLGPFQGFVAAVLGVLFFTKKKDAPGQVPGVEGSPASEPQSATPSATS